MKVENQVFCLLFLFRIEELGIFFYSIKRSLRYIILVNFIMLPKHKNDLQE